MAEREIEIVEAVSSEAGTIGTLVTYVGGYAFAVQLAGGAAKAFVPGVADWVGYGEERARWRDAVVDGGFGLIPVGLGIALLGGTRREELIAQGILALAGWVVGVGLIPFAELTDMAIGWVGGLFKSEEVVEPSLAAAAARADIRQLTSGTLNLGALRPMGNDVGTQRPALRRASSGDLG